MASLFENKLFIAVSAPAKHGKSMSTLLLIDLLYIDLVTKRKGWKAEIFDRSSKSFNPYTLGKLPYKDIFVVFSYKEERKIAIVTAGDVWSTHVVDSYQELIRPYDIHKHPRILQDSYEVVVGCCHPNNKVKKQLVQIANDSGYEMMETSPYYQMPALTSTSPKTPIYIWNYLFAKHLEEIILNKIGNLGSMSKSSGGCFSKQISPLVFAMMEDFKNSKNGFGFDIRKTNRKGRKEQGLIFLGNDDYLRVSLSDEPSESMRSCTLGLVFRQKEENAMVECYLEVVCDNTSKKLSKYQDLVSAITPASQWEKISCTDRFLMQYTICNTSDYLSAVTAAREFLKDYAKTFKSKIGDVLIKTTK